jgi:hypothetical protein
MDPVERARRPALLYGSLAFPLIGPAAILIGYFMFVWGSPEVAKLHLLPFGLVFLFLQFWAYWHVVRQHYGIMSLYKRKNGDTAEADFWVDNAVLYGGLLLPLLALILRHPVARSYLGMPAALSFWDEAAVTAAAWLITALAALFVARQIALARAGEPVNVAKCLFLLAVVPLHVFVAWHPATLATGLIGFAAFVTIYHDLQYHAIVWHAQQMKLAKAEDPSKHGLSAWVSGNIFIFLGCATLMGVIAWYIGCKLDIRPGCVPLLTASEVELFGDVTLEYLLGGIVFGFIMHHYFVDQFIWRPSKDEAVRKELAA